MLFLGHLLLGFCAFLILLNLNVIAIPTSFQTALSFIALFAVTIIASLLPDIDEANSKINKWSGVIGKIITKLFQHRDVIHSLILFVTFAVLAYKFLPGKAYAIAILAGYTAHILGDAITPMGVKIFIPLSEFKLKGPIKVGTWKEKALYIIFAAINIYLLWRLF